MPTTDLGQRYYLDRTLLAYHRSGRRPARARCPGGRRGRTPAAGAAGPAQGCRRGARPPFARLTDLVQVVRLHDLLGHRGLLGQGGDQVRQAYAGRDASDRPAGRPTGRPSADRGSPRPASGARRRPGAAPARAASSPRQAAGPQVGVVEPVELVQHHRPEVVQVRQQGVGARGPGVVGLETAGSPGPGRPRTRRIAESTWTPMNALGDPSRPGRWPRRSPARRTPSAAPYGRTTAEATLPS